MAVVWLPDAEGSERLEIVEVEKARLRARCKNRQGLACSSRGATDAQCRDVDSFRNPFRCRRSLQILF